ncbi:MAG: bifunctional diguanylate cyclase/phosphodiesterase [Ruminococcus sp.]|nr:bifunctional diguanylate cyclase/phosphodiesterase [Ruminococcus sp.]
MLLGALKMIAQENMKLDKLTGTYCSDGIKDVVEEMISSGKKNAFILLDLDCFTKINDVLGRETGDDVLVSVVNTLKRGLRKDDIIGRIDGDGFLVCINDIDHVSTVERIAKHICVLTKHSLSKGVYVSASLGIVLAPGDADSYSEVIRKAECAMLHVKKNGGNDYVFYSEELENDNLEVELERHIKTRGIWKSRTDSEDSMLVNYDISTGEFLYPEVYAEHKGKPLWSLLLEKGVCSAITARQIKLAVEEIAQTDVPKAQFSEFYMKNNQGAWCWFMLGFICAKPKTVLSITFTDINNEVVASRNLVKFTEHDELTGLLNRNAFCRTIEDVYTYDAEGMSQGKYAVIYFDIQRFKAINDIFGMHEGDRLLIYIADVIMHNIRHNDCGCRIGSDRFAIFVNIKEVTPEKVINMLFDAISTYDLPFEITFNAGVYITNEEKLSGETMIDRAILAQSAIKGSYTRRFRLFTEEIRHDMLSEQEIVGLMTQAVSEKQFVVHYQPQYNHSTRKLIGAEALVRWSHPEKGLVQPTVFIPIFEKNGFITNLDLYVFEEVCIFLRKCIDEGMVIVPISTNFSRFDIFSPDFVEKIEEIRNRYDIPVKYLRVELTESAVFGNSQKANEVIAKLHEAGYIVEMDDFGSGYSSLNVLKELELDTIKLDMQFLRDEKQSQSHKGGTILSSVVRMAKWLKIPVIAEGVENCSQADFLTSIGCEYIQGFLYSRPLSEKKYIELVNASRNGISISQMDFIDTVDALNFWSPKSQETLIFNNYVGGAAIFEYDGENVEVLRVNKKYLQEFCMNLTENDLINGDPMRFFDQKNKSIFIDTLLKAIETGEEQECETERTIFSACCEAEQMFIRSSVIMIGKSDNSYLFYATVRNITAEKRRIDQILESEKRFKIISEQAQIYHWEYNIATKEMRPCYRCIRDLGLTEVVKNFPESLAEKGIISRESYDLCKDWTRQLEEGVTELEAVIPLTEDKIPFVVRYTTEFDENGRPVKAYGSAVKSV